ncbi:MAG: prepilin peptidase [Clostridiales bacterium]|nr:prepilin peptidase [Clostridiales bacterium]
MDFVGIYYIITSTLFGIVIGSFLNVVIYRVPAGRTIVKGHSMCMTCGHNLAAKDLIPIISWATLKGKCRYCGAPIASRYTKIESFNGVVFLLAALGSFRYAALALIMPGYNVQTLYILYSAVYCIAMSCAVSAMMIYYDTGKGFAGPAVCSLILKAAAVALPFIFPVETSSVLTQILLSVLSAGCPIAVALILCLVLKKKYTADDLFMDLTITTIPSYGLFYFFGSNIIQISIFSLLYGVMRALLKGTSKDKYSGIIAVVFLMAVCLVHTVLRLIGII